jgi:hypothetical protein
LGIRRKKESGLSDKRTRKRDAFGAIRIPGRFSRTFITFSYPDYTVGPGVSPDPAPVMALAGCTADWELLSLTLPRRCLFYLHEEYTIIRGLKYKKGIKSL